MLNSGIIGVAIGLILLYFLLSLLVSGINELAETILHRRAKYLEVGIWDLFRSRAAQFYKHPLIQQLKPHRGRPWRVVGVRNRGRRRKVLVGTAPNGAVTEATDISKKQNPSYISTGTFSAVVMDLLEVEQLETTVLADHRIEATNPGPLQITLKDVRGFPADPGFDIIIGGETFHVTATGPPARRWTVARADPTKATAHAVGEAIRLVAGQAAETALLFKKLEDAVNSVHLGPVSEALKSFLATANRDVDQWRSEVERWYDDKMERLSGWYKRRTKGLLFAFGLVVALVLNADSVAIGTALYKDATLRSSVTAQAQKVVTDSPDCKNDPDTKDNPVACVIRLVDQVKGLDVPLGWPTWPNKWRSWYVGGLYATDARVPHAGGQWWLKIAGILLTGLALSLGAPFWFDLLNKVTNFRSTGTPPPKSGSDQSSVGSIQPKAA
jgi:hypothetical protein